MKRKTILLCLLLVFCATGMFAQQISVFEAQQRASAFLSSNAARRAPSANGSTGLSLAYTMHNKKANKVCFYVFNRGIDNGFVIIGGDESARQILGYSNNGSFDYDKIPANFKWWLSQYQEQISHAITVAEKAPEMIKANKAAVQKKNAAKKASVSPLLTTTWNQDSPYSDAINADWHSQCPGMANVNFVTGCVATAMAQVMNYHEWPVTGTGSHSKTTTYNGSYVFEQSADFGSTTYDWANMLDDYSGASTQAQKNAVATLMYHCGVAVDMNYNTAASGGSGAVSRSISEGLTSYFDYDKSVRYEERAYYTDDEWEAMMYNELVNNRPVLYGGAAENGGGHQFVCDGYNADDDTYHFNWGWGGYCDCFCPMTGSYAITPGGTGIGGAGSSDSYAIGQDAVINVKRQAGGLESPILYEYKNYANNVLIIDGNTTYKNYEFNHTGSSKILKLQTSVWNLSNTLTSFTLGVKATDLATGLVYYWTCSDKNLDYSYITIYSDLAFDVNDIPFNGTYEIRPVGRNVNSTSDADWYPIGINHSISSLPTLVITGAAAPEQHELTLGITANEVEVGRTIKITHDKLYSGQMSLSCSPEGIVSVSDDGTITGVKKGKATVTVNAEEDTYFFAAQKSFDVVVVPFVKNTADITISQTIMHRGATADINITDGYDGTPSYSSSKTSVATVSNGTVTAKAIGKATITVTLPATEMYEANTATFDIEVVSDAVYLTEEPYFDNDNNPCVYDDNIHFTVHNSSSQDITKYLCFNLKEVKADNTLRYLGGTGMGWNLPAGYTLSSVQPLSNWGSVTFVPGQLYRLEFVENDWSTPWNVKSIDFIYRAPLNYDYTLTDAGVGTLILPFNAEIPANVDWQLFECAGLDGGTLLLRPAAEIKRNVPYIVSGTPATATFAGPNAIDQAPVLFGDNILKGTMLENKYQFTDGDYILQKQNDNVAFYKYTTGNWAAAPFRAFVQTTVGGSKINIFGDDDDTTSISDIVKTLRPAGIYTIDGKRRTQLTPGLNIIVDEAGNAKKVFITK